MCDLNTCSVAVASTYTITNSLVQVCGEWVRRAECRGNVAESHSPNEVVKQVNYYVAMVKRFPGIYYIRLNGYIDFGPFDYKTALRARYCIADGD